jgi:hypothetical protein
MFSRLLIIFLYPISHGSLRAKKPIWNFNAAPRYLRRMWMIILPVIVILWALTMAALARHRRRR